MFTRRGFNFAMPSFQFWKNLPLRYPLTSIAALGGSSLVAGTYACSEQSYTSKPALDQLNEHPTDMTFRLKSLNKEFSGLEIERMCKALAEAISNGNKEMVDSIFQDFSHANIKVNDDFLNAVIDIAARYGKTSILKKIGTRFGDACTHRNPLARQLLESSAGSEIEALVQQFKLGHIKKEGSMLSLAERRENMLLDTPSVDEAHLSGDIAEDINILLKLSKEQERIAEINERMLARFNEVVVIDNDFIKGSPSQLLLYLKHVKKLCLQEGRPVRSTFMLSSSHFTHGSILVKPDSDHVTANILYFDSLGARSDSPFDDSSILDAIEGAGFSSVDIKSSEAKIQYSPQGCSIFAFLGVLNAIFADDILGKMPQYDHYEKENCLFHYADEYETTGCIPIYEQYGVDGRVCDRFHLFCPPAYMNIGKQTFTNNGESKEDYGWVTEDVPFERLGRMGVFKEKEASPASRKLEYDQVASISGESWEDLAKKYHQTNATGKKVNRMIDVELRNIVDRIVPWLAKKSPHEIECLQNGFSLEEFMKRHPIHTRSVRKESAVTSFGHNNFFHEHNPLTAQQESTLNPEEKAKIR